MTGEVNYNIPSNNLYVLNGKTSDTLNLNDLKDKIVVLDFWNNNCGICFQKFPQLKKLKDKYKNNDNISFYAINAYKSKEEIKIGQQLFDSLDNGINTYFLSKDKSESLRIQGFPTVLVIKNNKVIFRGSIEALSIFDKFYLK
jgi:thiol-disulfide isomerase/thioredoxin